MGIQGLQAAPGLLRISAKRSAFSVGKHLHCAARLSRFCVRPGRADERWLIRRGLQWATGVVTPVMDKQCTHLGLRWLGSGGNKIMASSVFGGLAGFFTGSIASVWAEPALKRTAPLSVGSKGMGIIAGEFTWLAAAVSHCWACMPLALGIGTSVLACRVRVSASAAAL